MQFSQKIFGIGLSRTGTTSLHIALLMLGISSVVGPEKYSTC
ncbi:sulfotransferase [Spiribacter onubensis]